MDFKILPILAFLSVAVAAVSHAASPSEEYWNSVLPNTAMPKAVKDLINLTSEGLEENSKPTGEDTGGVNVHAGGTTVTVGSGGVNVTKKNGTHVAVSGGITIRSHNNHGKPVYVRVAPGPEPFIYRYGASDAQLRDSPNVALFFLEKDLYAGNKMTLRFTKPTNQQKFLPRHVADAVPFSSNDLPEIYSEFSVNPGSVEAEVMKKTVKECEDGGIKGEEKMCATSLESMVDFATSKLGKNVEAVSTDADSGERKMYRIEGVRKKGSEKPVVVCHKQEYAYAVFYCHKTETTVAYGVSMVGGSESKAEAVAVCHRDTAEWNPKHMAFQVLKVTPGSVPVCHYLPQNHIVWVSKN